MGSFLGNVGSFLGSVGPLLAAEILERLRIPAPSFASNSPIDAQRIHTSDMSQPPALTPLSLSHLCARYLRVQFENKLNAHSPNAGVKPVDQPWMLLVALASELDLISATLVDAFRNSS